MKILSIDTSTMISSCSVMEDGIIIGDYNINQELTHSETLVPMIKDLLKNLNIKIEDIDLYVVGKGPGSFTGLRIGMTVGKTFAQIFNKDIIGISTLKALASQIISDKIIVPILDARGGRVYYGVYKYSNNEIINIEDDNLIYFDELMNKLNEKYDEIIFVGDINSDFEMEIKENNKFSIAPASLNSCIGRSLCFLANKEKNGVLEESYLTLKPEYIRKSQAQRDLEMKIKNV
ncbi:tRNA (adenosine(37)-N6)-threonylcarbamoyltransferase complex dimerization subunit type 1 TsaB [Miniphocaeibacter halophilus]|uniref:tRNA (Adenosine(37)-N6)-threonylcarbamoyltransferase complex dimerization subunit type 1 TsaB n=1 Tax=Miniphocaeibacter halophilus TaxID=2931922 RepID=A0AC61MU22_9FIRM|nr:tRNA (adenosine(37)-N6)-threonylcarbamoyltransferase complex dimerization subunit type 1 TsaB [Miniphocaeibacter halophilus]QQK07846.1 tRNA (adenosine(37)-N6)-threonylcarbamoyltransferase complex dimerization subunit type 1 TsaB [Miniphocaeibacter halophilus]